MKKLLLIVFIALALASCERQKTYFLRSCVMSYFDAEKMVLQSYQDGHVSIEFVKKQSLGDFQSTGQLKESYDALCEKHNDMTFMQERKVSVDTWTVQLGIDFVSIDIVSDSDFDGEHPAGTSLADILKFSSRSLKPYIDSGYTSKYTDRNGVVFCSHPVYELVSELTPDQLILLGDRGYVGSLRFEQEPVISKEHTFTVTMTADDGRVFTASIEMTFD